jgi:hypothetical protein
MEKDFHYNLVYSLAHLFEKTPKNGIWGVYFMALQNILLGKSIHCKPHLRNFSM